ncbi:uncharacterized protein LOC127712203 [Mytilus californianus]|uniref:uncharacterized protein LOC127712203 n=1 Tax=Mytilus californianus TaxID=6549 RepID=UPI002247C527|nr:uncharacterized protein LOC127712203 [Mytilus californianus]
MVPSKWSFMTSLLLILFSTVYSLSTKDKNAANYGLAIGKGIADLLEKRDFAKSLTMIGKSIGPYLGALGPIVGVIMAFIPSESAELAFMKKMMKEIDTRLDHIDNRFNDIERLIEWSVVKVNFGQIEQNIKVVSREFQYIYAVPQAAVENRKVLYLSRYDNDYQNSGTKLYDVIVEKQGLFQEDLGTSVMRYTKIDRRKTQLFLLGVMQLLLQAVKVELGYLLVKQYTHNAHFMQLDWENRIQKVRRKFEEIDNQCVVKYHTQSGNDIDEYSSANKDLTNRQFANGLLNLLRGKYDWRDWVVIAYDPVKGGDKHWIGVSGGHMKFRKDGRNIVVASVDKSHSVMDLARAELEMKTVSTTKKNWWHGIVARAAKDIFYSLDKRGASLVSVIRSDEDANYFGDSLRAKFVRRAPYYELLMWG